jgi:hypothetical protein
VRHAAAILEPFLRRAAATTRMPAAASRRAIAAPLLAPVTKMV